ncbi:TIGR03086 family protein [Actinacidiphila yanglinensis]|uniref:TIGR03086 family protein n=1 Tax=Actinacidiphila yanglinensis TaxID=310779 RepID=A0A1H6AL43_9ACTN|nr:TIGR03086 family metal-binding protein [Actinacidiphila yanglinensis]SEG48745.1 TIGR03086 family protein [Actinacidiphila yanglinensis]
MESQQDSAPFRQLSRAFASTRAVLARVGPDGLDAGTPCRSWDVRALINHLVDSARWGASATLGTGGEHTDEDFAAGDFLAVYDDGIKVALAAFGSAGVLEGTFELGFGTLSGAGLMGLLARDQFTHGWDLARALGHDTDLDPGLADELLAQARVEIPDAYRGGEGEAPFGPVVEAPTGAYPADRLAAFLGRST